MAEHGVHNYHTEGNRPASKSSIDLTLELEHQLENESLQGSRPQSLDTHVLASLVTTLRLEVAELRKDKEELSSSLESSKEREEDMRKEFHRMMGNHATMEEEVQTLKRKNQEAEDCISVLRSKVEDSRRALMRLQTESRRSQSHKPGAMSVDLSRAGTFSFGGGPPSAKRASFQPLAGSPAGRGHQRRVSNTSNAEYGQELSYPRSRLTPSPRESLVPLPDIADSPPPSTPTRARPQDSDTVSVFTDAEAETLQRQVLALKTSLEEMKNELSEANEAREASDTCVKTLREFIAEHNIGAQAPTPPELPPVVTTQRPGPDRKATVGGARWGFGLWKSVDQTQTQTQTASPISAVSTRSVHPPEPQPTQPVAQTLADTAPLRKLTGFFGRRPSMSIAQQQESTSNSSDTSSSSMESPEPVSPLEPEHHRHESQASVGGFSKEGGTANAPETIEVVQ
ncbi:hypothetical protein OF83DRAFT_1081211 [Amylostereum chailletii]|nr:hypothetical protein OF83DRAFT_1081211 [Amylostereum chailletii]